MNNVGISKCNNIKKCPWKKLRSFNENVLGTHKITPFFSYISNIITNPYSSGLKYFAVSDKNSLITFNVKNTLANSNIVLNVDYAKNTFDADKHTIWKLISEGDPTEVIPTTIENKWYDSLIGSDTAGNLVPDLDLATNRKYGNLLRPRQSWYVDRFDALKQVIDYANSVLKKNQLANTISYTNLNAADPEPTSVSGEWDASVDTYADLTYLDTRDISGTVNYLFFWQSISNLCL